MDNRIRDLVLTDHRLDFAESEIHLTVYPERLTAATEVKGRLMGPSSAYTSTVEVAYHWREFERTSEYIRLRVVIPEPCFWEPQKAFLYHGPLELLQDGRRCEQRLLRHALRQVRIVGAELRVNGKSMPIRGTGALPTSDDEARALHEQGYNVLLVLDPAPASRDFADRFGLLVLKDNATKPLD